MTTTKTVQEPDVPIGSGITAVDLPDGDYYSFEESTRPTILGPAGHSLLSIVQIREHGIYVDEKPRYMVARPA